MNERLKLIQEEEVYLLLEFHQDGIQKLYKIKHFIKKDRSIIMDKGRFKEYSQPFYKDDIIHIAITFNKNDENNPIGYKNIAKGEKIKYK